MVYWWVICFKSYIAVPSTICIILKLLTCMHSCHFTELTYIRWQEITSNLFLIRNGVIKLGKKLPLWILNLRVLWKFPGRSLANSSAVGMATRYVVNIELKVWNPCFKAYLIDPFIRGPSVDMTFTLALTFTSLRTAYGVCLKKYLRCYCFDEVTELSVSVIWLWNYGGRGVVWQYVVHWRPPRTFLLL